MSRLDVNLVILIMVVHANLDTAQTLISVIFRGKNVILSLDVHLRLDLLYLAEIAPHLGLIFAKFLDSRLLFVSLLVIEQCVRGVADPL